ncbi:MAG: zinc-dependent metalloprotease [Actinomycetota bacterium]|nr:zinc-dependent metalloprotease [Actinomycetota bacterium]
MSQEPWGDIPLFREIQRILSSSHGPVNAEIASQVATALATQDGDSVPDPARARLLADAVRDAELMLAGYTRLAVEEPAAVRLTSRAEWAKSTLDAWTWMFEDLARKFTAGAPGEEVEDAPAGMAAALGQVAPLLIGIQVGTLVGRLAQRAIGRYDYPIPRDDDGRLLFVDPNLARLAGDYGFDREAFLRWLALAGSARHLVTAHTPWLGRYWRSLVTEIVEAMEIDAGELQSRMTDLQSRGPEALQEGIDDGFALPLVPTDRHQRAVARLRSFVAAFEGYARYSAGAVGDAFVGAADQIEEGMARHRRDANEGAALLETLLGVAFDRDLENAGATFCAAVVKLKGVTVLNSIWDAPDNLPSYAEIKDPFAWMERIGEDS